MAFQLMSSNLGSTHIHWHRSSSQLLFSSSTGPPRIYERAEKSSSRMFAGSEHACPMKTTTATTTRARTCLRNRETSKTAVDHGWQHGNSHRSGANSANHRRRRGQPSHNPYYDPSNTRTPRGRAQNRRWRSWEADTTRTRTRRQGGWVSKSGGAWTGRGGLVRHGCFGEERARGVEAVRTADGALYPARVSRVWVLVRVPKHSDYVFCADGVAGVPQVGRAVWLAF